MGVIAVAEITCDGDFNVDEKGNLKTSRRFLVQMDLTDIEPSASDAVASVFGIHHLDPHPVNPHMRALTIEAKRVSKDTLGYFYVTVMYDSKLTDEKSTSTDPSQDDQSVQPDQRPYLVSMDQVDHDVLLAPTDNSAMENPVVNAAGTPFDPPPTVAGSFTVYTIEGYKALNAVQPTNKANFYMNTVNSDDYNLPGTFGKILAETGRIKKYSFKQVYENSDYWYKFQIQIIVNPDGWNPLEVLNAGCYKILSNSLPPQPIIVNGKPVTKPVPLKADGSGPLNAGDTPNYISFTAYTEETWSGAGNLI